MYVVIGYIRNTYSVFLRAQINDNGVISFNRPFHVVTPMSFPLRTSSHKIIAPYWANVDTLQAGRIYYRQTLDPFLLARATSEIRSTFPMSQNVTITHLLIVTWDGVGYPQGSDRVCTT